MPLHTKLEFQITLTDWLLFKGQEQSTLRVALVQIAQNSKIPLWVLLGLTILTSATKLLGVATVSFPIWSPIAVLGLLAVSHVYLALPSNQPILEARHQWKEQLANSHCTVQVFENGIRYVSGSALYDVKWTEIGKVYQTKRLLIFSDEEDEDALAIPKRAFTSRGLTHFIEFAYQKTVVERGEKMANEQITNS